MSLVDRANPVSLVGLGLILLAAFCGAAGNNVLKHLGPADKIGVAIWMSLAAPLPLIVLSVAFDPGVLSANLANIGWVTVTAVAYSALLATIAAFAIWGRLLTHYPASAVVPFFLLVPVFGISLSVLLLGESFTTLRLLGGGFIFAGLMVTVVTRRRLISLVSGRLS